MIIMSSFLELHQPTLQTITAVEHASTLLGTLSSWVMKSDDLITFTTEEAQHCTINDECTKNTESAFAALGKKQRTGKQCSNKGKEKSTPSVTCENCKKHRPHQGRLLVERRRQRKSRAKGTKLQERRKEGGNSGSSRSD